MRRHSSSGARTEVKKEKIEGHEVTFSVDEDGTWYASAAILEQSVWGKTVPETRAKVTAKLRRVTAKLEIKAHLVNLVPEEYLHKPWYEQKKAVPNLVRPITLTGISQRSSDVMYRFDDSGGVGKKSPHQSHTDPTSIGVVCRRLSKAEEAEYVKRRKAFDDATAALDEWITAHKIENVETFMEQKISEAVDQAEPESEPEPTEDPREAPLRDSRLDGTRHEGGRTRPDYGARNRRKRRA